MPRPDDNKEPGEPRPLANDNLESLAAALDEIAAQAAEDDAGSPPERKWTTPK